MKKEETKDGKENPINMGFDYFIFFLKERLVKNTLNVAMFCTVHVRKQPGCIAPLCYILCSAQTKKLHLM